MSNAQQHAARLIQERPIDSLKPYARNARTHSKKQIKQIAASIERSSSLVAKIFSDSLLYSFIAVMKQKQNKSYIATGYFLF